MAMFLAVAVIAKRNAVRDIEAKVDMRGEGLDVVRVKFHRLAVVFVVSCSAFLARPVVAGEDCDPPSLELWAFSGQPIRMGFVDMAGEAFLLCGLVSFNDRWIRGNSTSCRADMSQLTFLRVLRHRLAANWAGCFYLAALRTNAICLRYLVRSFPAGMAADTNLSGVCGQMRGAGRASRVRCWPSRAGNTGRRLVASGAWSKASVIAVPAKPVVGYVAA